MLSDPIELYNTEYNITGKVIVFYIIATTDIYLHHFFESNRAQWSSRVRLAFIILQSYYLLY